MEKYCRGRAALRCWRESKSSRSPASGKKKMEPRAPEIQHKTTSFWVGLDFFKNQNTPKQRCFEVPDFFFLKLHHQNDVVLCSQP